MPLSEDRRLTCNSAENFLNLLKYFKGRYSTIEEPFLDTFYKPKENLWDRKMVAVELLRRRKFFNRYSSA